MGDALRDIEAESRYKETQQRYYCGIDVGFSGAVAIINDKHRVVECWGYAYTYSWQTKVG